MWRSGAGFRNAERSPAHRPVGRISSGPRSPAPPHRKGPPATTLVQLPALRRRRPSPARSRRTRARSISPCATRNHMTHQKRLTCLNRRRSRLCGRRSRPCPKHLSGTAKSHPEGKTSQPHPEILWEPPVEVATPPAVRHGTVWGQTGRTAWAASWPPSGPAALAVAPTS